FGGNSTSSGSFGVQTDVSGSNTVINANEVSTQFALTYTDPKTGANMLQTVTVKKGDTAQDLADIINSKTSETGVVASFVTDPKTNQVSMRLESTTGKPIKVVDGNPLMDTEALKTANFTTVTAPEDGGWNQRIPQDAKFTIDGIPTELTSATNELTEVFDGLSVKLLSEGKTNLNVTTSTKDMKTKIEDIVKETNKMLAKFSELTKVSSEKTPSSITNTDGTPNYGSQFSSQMGSVLTGNYGVQLLSSHLKSAITGQSIGFKSQEMDKAGKIIPDSGDPFTALSSIGIVFDAEQGSPTYGQLKFLTEGETTKSYKENGKDDTEVKMFRTLDEALAEDPLAVADMLIGNGGSSDSPDFDYVSHIPGTTNAATKAGTYKVSYDVAADGTVGKVYVNGVEAVLAKDSTTPNLYEVPSGAAKGLALSLNNLQPGKHEGTLRIKQGKITQLTGMLSDEIAADDITKDSPTGAKRGSLVILKDNYMSIMKNIQEKIDRETTRISKWETTQKMKFARLDALLGRYDKQMTANASSLAQLDSGAK
ncbi:MAG: flagellar filament capping protein FliD, partial [Bilophila sp.]